MTIPGYHPPCSLPAGVGAWLWIVVLACVWAIGVESHALGEDFPVETEFEADAPPDSTIDSAYEFPHRERHYSPVTLGYPEEITSGNEVEEEPDWPDMGYPLPQVLDPQAGSDPTLAAPPSGPNPFARLPGLRGVRGATGLLGNLMQMNPHIGGTWYPSKPVEDQPTTLGMQRGYFRFMLPVFQRDRDTVVFSAHGQQTNIQTDAILPDTLDPFPKQLSNLWLGINYFHTFDGGYLGGVMLDGGSASDKPFHDRSDTSAAGTAFVLLPHRERNAWLLSLHASTNSQILAGLPIPGAAYLYNPSDEFQAMIGIPCSINYRPRPDLTFQILYILLTTIHARALYQPTDDLQFYAGFDWSNENYFRSNREVESDLFYYYEKRLALGAVWWMGKHIGLDASTGYTFDRYFIEGNSLSLSGDNRVAVGNAIFANLQLDMRF